jgi:hypothetical protein
MLLSESIVLVKINLIETFLVFGSGGCIINTCLEDVEFMGSISNYLISITTGASLNWEVIRVLEEITRSFLLKNLSTFCAVSWSQSPLVIVL